MLFETRAARYKLLVNDRLRDIRTSPCSVAIRVCSTASLPIVALEARDHLVERADLLHVLGSDRVPVDQIGVAAIAVQAEQRPIA